MDNIIKDIKGIFKLPKKRYYLGKLSYGSPYMYPSNFNSSIISINKEKRKYARNSFFNLFGYVIYYGWPIYIVKTELGWKDKFNSPRHEYNPSFQIYFFKWQFCIWQGSPFDDGNDDKYWEQVLWYLYYSEKDIIKSKDSWGWIDYETKESTWDNKYLI